MSKAMKIAIVDDEKDMRQTVMSLWRLKQCGLARSISWKSPLTQTR